MRRSTGGWLPQRGSNGGRLNIVPFLKPEHESSEPSRNTSTTWNNVATISWLPIEKRIGGLAALHHRATFPNDGTWHASLNWNSTRKSTLVIWKQEPGSVSFLTTWKRSVS